jgi:hypothetical protein
MEIHTYQYEDEPLLSPQPYTYCIRHLLTNNRYYGASVGRWSNPCKLLHTHFPKSKAVQNLIERDGVESFVIEEIQLWDTPDEANAWKKNVLTTVDASSSELWLNEHNGQGHTAECIKKASEPAKNNVWWIKKNVPHPKQKKE